MHLGIARALSHECLIVEVGIWDRPVQVLLGQSFAAEAVVVCHPPSVVKIPLSTDGHEVDKGLLCLLREPGGQNRRHHVILFTPN